MEDIMEKILAGAKFIAPVYYSKPLHIKFFEDSNSGFIYSHLNEKHIATIDLINNNGIFFYTYILRAKASGFIPFSACKIIDNEIRNPR